MAVTGGDLEALKGERLRGQSWTMGRAQMILAHCVLPKYTSLNPTAEVRALTCYCTPGSAWLSPCQLHPGWGWTRQGSPVVTALGMMGEELVWLCLQ